MSGKVLDAGMSGIRDNTQISDLVVAHPAAGAPAVPDCLVGETIPAVIGNAGPDVLKRFVTFFAASIENVNTADAYARAVLAFFHWCDDQRLAFEEVQAVHVSGYTRVLKDKGLTDASIKARLAGIKSLFRFFVEGGLLRVNPASEVRGPRLRRREGKTPVLSGEEMRQLLDAIGTDTLRDLRDRALFATLAYAFPRISTALALRVADFESSSGGWTLYLKGKGGEAHRHAVHHEAAEWLNDWLEAAALRDRRDAFIFQAIGPPRGTDQRILHRAMSRTSAFEMVKRRARSQGLNPALCTHSFRATGVTAYVEAGGALETAARMAGHADVRTTQLYVRKVERSLQSEVERIRFGK